MDETYTYYDALVQFLYHELPAEEAAEMRGCMVEDASLMLAYQQMFAARAEMPKALFNPSAGTLSNILRYSAQTALELQS